MIAKIQKATDIIIPVKEEHKTKLASLLVGTSDQLDAYLEELYAYYTYQSVAAEYGLTQAELKILYHYCTDELTDNEICTKLRIKNNTLFNYKASIFKKMKKSNLLEIKLKLIVINTSAVININQHIDLIFNNKDSVK